MAKRNLIGLFSIVIILFFGSNLAYGQCGADGTQRCNPKPKPTPKPIPKKTTPKPIVTKSTTSTKKSTVNYFKIADECDDDDYDCRIETYTKAIEKNYRKAEAYIFRGQAYNNNNDFDLAIEDFNSAIKLSPKNSEAYENRGMTYGNKQDYEQSMKDYGKAIEFNPKSDEAHIGLGNAF